MCDQRERLIGYIYDECEPADRAAMQQHLETCADCRAEIAALRSVREDLQTWEVPAHESVWKPFTPAPAPAWWSQVPRWAMAAAAGLVLASGAAGGAMSFMLLRQQPLSAAPQTVAKTEPSVTINHVQALERRLEGLIREEVSRLNTRVALFGSDDASSASADAFHNSFERQLSDLRQQNERQFEVIRILNANIGQYQKGFGLQQSLIKSRVENLALAVEQGGGKQ